MTEVMAEKVELVATVEKEEMVEREDLEVMVALGLVPGNDSQ